MFDEKLINTLKEFKINKFIAKYGRQKSYNACSDCLRTKSQCVGWVCFFSTANMKKRKLINALRPSES